MITTRKYRDYISSERWREIRLEKLKSVDYRCERCGGMAVQVHHKTYAHLGDESLDDLEALCKACHDEKHLSSPYDMKSYYRHKQPHRNYSHDEQHSAPVRKPNYKQTIHKV